jgi:hypothetical protein
MEKMTVSQALRRIAKLKGQISELRTRAAAGVSYKSADKPAFDFKECVKSIAKTQTELVDLQTRIAVANANTTLTFGDQTLSLTEAIIQLQSMKGDIVWLKSLASRAQSETEERDYDFDDDGKRKYIPVKWTCDLPEADRAGAVDVAQKKFDELNDEVERMNHTTQV